MLKRWRRVSFKVFVALFVVNKCVHFVTSNLRSGSIFVSLGKIRPDRRLVTRVGEYGNVLLVSFQSFQCLLFSILFARLSAIVS